MADALLEERLLAGDKRALARAISLVENNDPDGWELVRQVYPKTGGAAVVGFTGPPGVGKSTLLGALTKPWRLSPITGEQRHRPPRRGAWLWCGGAV